MQKSARENLIKSKVTKSIIRHNSQKRLFIQKRDSNSTRDLGSSESVRNLGHTASQSSLVKLKRAPLKNVALMRSQSNLSLYKMNSEKQMRVSKESIMKSSFKSPDFTYKCPKLSYLNTMGKDDSYNNHHLMSTQVIKSKNNDSSELSIEPTTLKNFQFKSKHTRISSTKLEDKKIKNCKK